MESQGNFLVWKVSHKKYKLFVLSFAGSVDYGLLIELVQANEYLFDLKHTNYKNTKKKEATWVEISNILNMTSKFFLVISRQRFAKFLTLAKQTHLHTLKSLFFSI